MKQLHGIYGEVCAYSSIWIPTGFTVDHFRPKERYAGLAYEWSNYRLALDRVNNSKGNSEVVLDPFVVQNGWFVLDAATLWVRPEPGLGSAIRARVQTTIDVLKLNHHILVNVRFQIFRGYLEGKQPLGSIEEKYPFIASEIRRQGVKTFEQMRAESAAGPRAGEPENPS